MRGTSLPVAVLLFCSMVASAVGQTAPESQEAGGAQRDPFAGWVPPKSEPVPPQCAAFIGKWVGRWLNYGASDYVLWVKDVSPTCVATFVYYDAHSEPPKFRKGEIKNGKLSYLCDPGRQGTCTFDLWGESMYASYSAQFGGSSSGTFRKVSTEPQ